MSEWIAGLKLPAALGLAAWLVAEVAAANVFVEDRREQRDGSLPLLRSVGMLVHPRGGGGGTAFLVGRCHIVTAHHVAYPAERVPVAASEKAAKGTVGQSAEFFVGPKPAAPGTFTARARATVVAAGMFSAERFEGMAGDWAILRLDRCLGKTFGFLQYDRHGQSPPLPAGELMTIGFPRSRARQAGITVETGCNARDYGPVPGLLGVDCAFEAGMSGGPVLERQEDGSWLVIGLIQQSTRASDQVLPSYSMAHRNQVVHVSAFRKALDRVLRSESRRVEVHRLPQIR
jgi:Trypsin-like peptidase domain